MRTKSALLIAAAGLALCLSALTSSAIAAGPAIDQYVETLPDSGGDQPSNTGSSGTGGDSGSGATGTSSSATSSGTGGTTSSPDSIVAPSVPSSMLSKLRSGGADGGAAARAIEAISGGAPSGALGGSGGGGGSGAIPSLDSAAGDTPVAGVISVLTGGGPGGFALPAILITVLAGGLVLAVRGRGSGDRS